MSGVTFNRKRVKLKKLLGIRARLAMLAVLLVAFVVVPLTASDYMFRAIINPFLIMSLVTWLTLTRPTSNGQLYSSNVTASLLVGTLVPAMALLVREFDLGMVIKKPGQQFCKAPA